MGKKVCIFFVNGISGGTATLSYRLGVCLQKRSYDVFYIKELSNDFDNETMMISNGIHVITVRKSLWFQEAREILKKYEEGILITYIYYYYHILESLKRRLKKEIRINTFVYSALPDCLIVGNRWKDKYFQVYKILNFLSKPYVQHLCKNKQILFQEEAGIQMLEEELDISIPDSENQIFRIPHDISSETYNIESRNTAIVTMARIDFPFKGYIVGLVDLFIKLKKKYPDLKLIIIGDGISINVLNNKVNQLPELLKQDVLCLGSMQYREALDLLQKCKVFVGMGTGVLDAASVSLPAIAVQCHTYECLCKGLFYEFPNDVGYYSNNGLHSAEIEIDRILNMNEQTYMDVAKKGKDAIVELYSCESFIGRLISLQNFNNRIPLLIRFSHALCLFALNLYHFVIRDNWNSSENK